MSVFGDIFKKCDRESKFVLLNEIMLSGDEKELLFLRTLTDHPDPRIRNSVVKAKKCIEKRIRKALLKQKSYEDKIIQTFFYNFENHIPQPVEQGERGFFECFFSLESVIAVPKAKQKKEEKPKMKQGLMSLEYCFLMDKNKTMARKRS